MKVSIVELRKMVSDAIKIAISEKKDIKVPAARSEESIEAQKEKKTRGLKGYSDGGQLDFSEPLGPNNRYKRQGASNIGPLTKESTKLPTSYAAEGLDKLISMVVREELPRKRKKNTNGRTK